MRGKKEGVVLGVEISRFLIWLYLQSKGGGKLEEGTVCFTASLKLSTFQWALFFQQSRGQIGLGRGEASWKEGRKVLETGLRWRIGSGSKVIIDEHPWLPKSEPVVPQC